MKKVKVLNGLPLGAISAGKVVAQRIDVEHVKRLMVNGFESYIGHEDTAKVLSNLLGYDIQFNRTNAELNVGDVIIVCAYRGPRLPEGATTLPIGASFLFFEVNIM